MIHGLFCPPAPKASRDRDRRRLAASPAAVVSESRKGCAGISGAKAGGMAGAARQVSFLTLLARSSIASHLPAVSSASATGVDAVALLVGFRFGTLVPGRERRLRRPSGLSLVVRNLHPLRRRPPLSGSVCWSGFAFFEDQQKEPYADRDN